MPPAKPSSSLALSNDARRELEEIYRQVDDEIAASGVVCWLRGECCDFEKSDHVLYASSVELNYVRETHDEKFAADSVLCPFWSDGLCVERQRRPLGCRTFFCDPAYKTEVEAIYEKYHRLLQELSRRHGIPYVYKPFVAALRRTSES